MNLVISGHRSHKLSSYNIDFIKSEICLSIYEYKGKYDFVMGFAGMASGVDIWFCQYCIELEIPFTACVPFEGQEATMTKEEAEERGSILKLATTIKNVKNSWMVEKADCGIIVWDGNKGGTHNVFQQMIENKKPFAWINPVWQKTVWLEP